MLPTGFKGRWAYSERSASTASFLEAMRAGICPPSMVRMVLIATRINACSGCKCATFSSDAMEAMMELMGKVSSQAMATPNRPEHSPRMNVSASNTWVMSFLRAPRERKMPISLVRSSTEV